MAWRTTLTGAHDSARQAEAEALAEIARLESWPDLAEIGELVGHARQEEAGRRAPLIREDVESMPLDVLVRRLEHVVAKRHGPGRRDPPLPLRRPEAGRTAGWRADDLRDQNGRIIGVSGDADPAVRALADQVVALRALVPSASDARATLEAQEALAAADDVIAEIEALTFEQNRYQGAPVLTGNR